MQEDHVLQGIELSCDLIKRFEGFCSAPYLCPAGVPTIGYGCTFYEDGTRVTLHDRAITRERATAMLHHVVVKQFLPTVSNLCPGLDTPQRLAAVLSWTYNLGPANLRASTMRKRINTQQWAEAAQECLRWVRAGGKVLKGLQARRRIESQLLL